MTAGSTDEHRQANGLVSGGGNMKANQFFSRTRLLSTVMPAALVVGSFALAGGALAQGEGTEGGIETMIVTAEFREAPLQKTPIAITAVGAEMIDARSQTNVFEIGAQAPNVTLKPHGQAFGSALVAFIRGVGQTDFNFASEPGVGVYVDDVYYATLTGNLLDLLDLERVEVARGPQGTLSGKNSLGGSIKLYTKQPEAENSGWLEGTYGKFNRIDVRGSANFTAIEDKMFVRVSGASRTRDGYVRRLDWGCMNPATIAALPPPPAGFAFPSNHVGMNCDLGTEGGQSYTAGRIAVRFTPTDYLDIKLTADAVNDKSEVQPGVLISATMFDPAFVQLFTGLPAGILGISAAQVPIYYDADGNGVLNPDAVIIGGVDYLAAGLVPYLTPGFDIPYDDRFATGGTYYSYANYFDGGFPTRFDCELMPLVFPPPPGGIFQCKDLNHYKGAGVVVPPINHFKSWGGSANIDWRINDKFSLKYIGSYRYYINTFANDDDASPLAVQQLLQQLIHEQWSQEVRLNGTLFNDFLDFTVGGFYQKRDGTLEARVDLAYVGFDFIHGPDPTPANHKAAYIHATAHVTDKLDVSLGGRYSKDVKDYMFQRHNPDNSPVLGIHECILPPWIDFVFGGNPDNCAVAGAGGVPLQGITGHFESSRTDYRIAVSYSFTDNFMIYFQNATGYKGGGINARPFVPDQVTTFAPETITAYEGGFKATVFDRAQVNLAYFYNVYKGIQLIRRDCSAISITAVCLMPFNAGDSHVQGVEVELLARPVDGLTIDGAFSWLEFKYQALDPTLPLGAFPITFGMITPYTPRLKWSVGGQYDIPLNTWGTLTPRMDAAYQSSIFTEAPNSVTNRIEGYTVANARLTWRSPDDQWSVSVAVTNLLGKYYYLTKNDLARNAGFVSGQPGRPREYAITLRRTF